MSKRVSNKSKTGPSARSKVRLGWRKRLVRDTKIHEARQAALSHACEVEGL